MDQEGDETRRGSGENQGERALVRRVQAERPHGTRAFRELVHTYTPLVYARALRLLASPQDAEEVVRDVFLRVFRSIGRFRFERPFLHWLQTITTNAARSFLRGRYREERKRSELATSLEPGHAGPPRSDADPFLADALGRAMGALEPTTRIAIALRYVEELSYPDISRELDMKESAAKMRVRRGVERLRRALEEEARGDR